MQSVIRTKSNSHFHHNASKVYYGHEVRDYEEIKAQNLSFSTSWVKTKTVILISCNKKIEVVHD